MPKQTKRAIEAEEAQKWIEGKTVRHVRIETHKGADCANANVHHTRYIEFTDGTYIFFAVGEPIRGPAVFCAVTKLLFDLEAVFAVPLARQAVRPA